jgi:hypothetical protein
VVDGCASQRGERCSHVKARKVDTPTADGMSTITLVQPAVAEARVIPHRMTMFDSYSASDGIAASSARGCSIADAFLLAASLVVLMLRM